MMSRHEQRHKQALDYLLIRPEALGIHSQVIWSAKEMLIYRRQGKSLVTEIDLFYQTRAGIYIVEYKLSENSALDAQLQLAKGAAFVRREFNVEPIKLYSHGPQYRTREIQ